jgi:hypothetical protein
MSSIFFQISKNDFVEASRTFHIPGKEFGVRIVSFQNGIPIFVYLPEMTLNELSVLASILKVRIVPNINQISGLQKYFTNVIYYY